MGKFSANRHLFNVYEGSLQLELFSGMIDKIECNSKWIKKKVHVFSCIDIRFTLHITPSLIIFPNQHRYSKECANFFTWNQNRLTGNLICIN